MTLLKVWIWIYVGIVMMVSLNACTHTQPPYEPPTKEERGFAGISTPMKAQAKEEM